MSGEQVSQLRSERRLALDGGLNTRAGVFMDPSQARALQNFRFTKEGEIAKRKGGSRLAAYTQQSMATNFKLTCTPSGAGGSLAAATYDFTFTIGTIHGATMGILTSTLGVVVGGAGAGSVLLQLKALNVGDGVGQQAGAYDDPINAGFVNNASLRVYARTGADAFTQQGALTFTWNSSTGAHETTYTTYTNNGSAAPGTPVALPVRSLHWHDELETTMVWTAEQCAAVSGAHTSRITIAEPKDASGNVYGFSRLPTRIFATILDGVMVVTDGVGKPRKLHTPTPSDAQTWVFRNCGLEVPSAPTAADNGAGLMGAGTYQYAVTFITRTTRPDGTTYDFESNPSALGSVTIGANRQVRVSNIPTSLETGFGGTAFVVNRKLYRSVAGGTTVVALATITGNVTTTHDDNVVDADLSGQPTPPNGANKIGNDPPPSKIHFITEHVQRLFSVVMKFKTDASGRIKRLQPTNEIRYTKAGSVDAWPTTFSFKCGSSKPITALRSFNGVLYAFKQNEIGVILGSGLASDLDFSYRTIWTGCGAMENSVVEVDNYLYAFSESLTAVRVSGYTVEPIGEDSIQTQWFDAITLDAGGEAATGGGRGAAAVLNVIYDLANSEVRWVMSDYVTDYTIVAATSYVMKCYEYVLTVRGRERPRFTLFTGSVSGTTKDRRIMGSCRSIVAANPIYPAYDCLYGDYHGRLVRDDQVEYDLDPSPAAITLSGEFPIFFGESPEAVKLYRFLYILLKMGATGTDSLTFKTKSLLKQAISAVTLVTEAGGVTEFRMRRGNIPKQPDTVNTWIQGLIVTVSGSAQSGPLRIAEMCARMTAGSEDRSAP